MKSKCVIDIYSGEAFDKAKHAAGDIHWCDMRLCYWGWIYSATNEYETVGDFTAETVQDAEAALGVKFNCK